MSQKKGTAWSIQNANCRSARIAPVMRGTWVTIIKVFMSTFM